VIINHQSFPIPRFPDSPIPRNQLRRNRLLSHTEHLTRRVVDPLSLATIANTKMNDVDRHRPFGCRFNRFVLSV